MKQYFVYIMASQTQRLYSGVTNNLMRRVWEHKHELVPGVTAKYKMIRMVYFDQTTDVRAAISREKQLKGWLRSRKIELIESINPNWHDLSDGWYEGSLSS